MKNKPKIMIIGPYNVDKSELSDLLSDACDFNVANRITDNDEMVNNHTKMMETELIYKCFQNNAFLFLNKIENSYIGITLDDFYNSEIFFMNFDEFNKISKKIFDSDTYDILIVWVDTKNSNENPQLSKDIFEIKFLNETLSSLPYLYFLDDNNKDIVKIIVEYLNANSDEKEKILENNN